MSLRIALLRGVNVGGKSIAMADLRAMAEGMGFSGVKTLLQSGNLVLNAGDLSNDALESALEAETKSVLSMEVRYIVRDGAGWRALIDANPFTAEVEDGGSRLLALVGREPMPEAALDDVRAVMTGGERLEAVGRDVYAWFPDGMGRSKAGEVLNRKAGKHLATGRNWNTVMKLAALVGL